MADTTLHFKVGSTFDGSGLVAANKEIQNAAKQGKKLSSALGNVISEAQKADGVLGKVACTVGNVVNGFSQLGIVGGIAAGAKSAMDWFFDSAKADLDKMVAQAKANADAMHRQLQRTVDSHIKGVHDANEATRSMGAEAVKQFDEVAAAAVKASQLIAQTDIARGQHSIAAVQVEKLNAMIKEETDAGKALVGAKYDLQIAEMKAAQSEERAATSSEAARKAVETARERQKAAQNQLTLAEQALAIARDKEARLSHVRSADTSKLAGEVKAAELAYKEALRVQRQSAQGISDAEERLRAAEIQQATAREEGQAAILQAQMALDKVNEAERKAAEAREKEAAEAEEAARKLAARNAAQAAYDDQVGLLKGLGEQRIGALADDIKKMREEIEQIGKDMDRVREGVETDAKVKNGLMGVYKYVLDKNGNPDNFIDWQRAMRYAERAERDRRNRERRDSQFQKKMQDLQDKLDKRGEKALTDREKEALKRWNEYQEQKNGRERREAEIKQKQLAIEKIRQQMADDLKEAKETLKQALELP